VPPKGLALAPIAARVVGEVVGLKLHVASQQPAARLREPGPEHLRAELAVVRIAETLGQVVKEREHDELLIGARLERARRRLQAMLIDVDRRAERIGVLERRHEREQALAGSALPVLALGALHEVPIGGSGLLECAKAGAFRACFGHLFDLREGRGLESGSASEQGQTVNDILKELAETRIINAAGSVTRLGASPIDPQVSAAMAVAAGWSVDIAQLQARASARIAAATGAEAGIVTSGAMAGLLVGAAACIAGLDPVLMARLPDTQGVRNEFIVARSHRNSYDHGVRAAGARLVEVGLPDRSSACGVRDTEAWEIASAIGERTAGVLWLARANARPSLESVVHVAHGAGIPVLVDAAAELTESANLRRYVDAGADLVVFSGGKSLGGPSASGILCGRRALIASALLQQLDLDYRYEDWEPPRSLIDKHALPGVPRHGIGRSCKVGKEQIVGLLIALERFVSSGDVERNERLGKITAALEQALAPLRALALRPIRDALQGGLPLLEVRIASTAPERSSSRRPTVPTGLDALTLAARLRAGKPAIHVDATAAEEGVLVLVPTCLALADVPIVRDAFASALGSS